MAGVKVAGIDCGTNSIRLMIATVDDRGMHVEVPRIMRVVRLGQDVDKTHRFDDAALARTYAAIDEFAEVLAEHPVDALRFVATSATRDAENRDEFEDAVFARLGVRPDVIPGSEEAALSFLGATSVMEAGHTADELPQAPYTVIDLGGGSTEMVIGGDGKDAPIDRVTAAFSMNIGSVRMSERHLVSDPPTDEEIRAAIEDIDEHIDEAFSHVPAWRTGTLIGVSGTVTTMSGIALGLKEYDREAVDGARIGFDEACETCDRVLTMTREQRREYPVIHPGRIDVIGGGALVWNRVLRRIGQAVLEREGRVLDSYITSEHGLLDGIVLDLGRRLLG
ncbi:Ppx/GppA phosphatase family protein [Bifidobacterium simiarum]|uniref:Ppx/GppA phosphatase family protein n=1 Tax=Bifidobacterium simiarum TaxID=2045441 RepID=UPI001BDCE322|nr:Ppx/GppA phosphatase family protein [Bifidobacterium simiarum]MBT1166677.1 Ppx/GppA family phosphatase [Bifidobacterium simiarum]